jgi:hypothetical protein
LIDALDTRKWTLLNDHSVIGMKDRHRRLAHFVMRSKFGYQLVANNGRACAKAHQALHAQG